MKQPSVVGEDDLLEATHQVLDPPERINWMAQADREDFLGWVLAKGWWWRAARILFCGGMSAIVLYATVCDLALHGRMPVLPDVICRALALAYCSAAVILAIVEPSAWTARATRVLYVVTTRRLLLIADTKQSFAWSIGRSVVAGDRDICPPTLHFGFRKRSTLPRISIRTVDSVVGTSIRFNGAATAEVVLNHHESRDEDGNWHPQQTILPGVRHPSEMVEHLERMSTFSRISCPKAIENVRCRCGSN